jgi:hypothetical protein
MRRHQRITVDLAVQILRAASARSGEEKVDTVPVRPALRMLWHHRHERWPLVTFWEAAGQKNEIGRAQGTTAAFNGILRQLCRVSAYSETSVG